LKNGCDNMGKPEETKAEETEEVPKVYKLSTPDYSQLTALLIKEGRAITKAKKVNGEKNLFLLDLADEHEFMHFPFQIQNGEMLPMDDVIRELKADGKEIPRAKIGDKAHKQTEQFNRGVVRAQNAISQAQVETEEFMFDLRDKYKVPYSDFAIINDEFKVKEEVENKRPKDRTPFAVSGRQ